MAGPSSAWGRELLPRALAPWRDAARGLDRRVWLVVTMTLLAVASRMSVYTFIGIYFARVVGIPIALVGLAFLVENIVRGLAMPVAGAISDRVGRKKVLVWAALASGATLPAFYFVPGPLSLFAWSVIVGIAQAPGWPVTSALLLDLVPRERAQSVLALNYTMLAVGYTVGVVPAGFLAARGYGPLAAASAIGFLLVAGLLVFGLRDLPRAEARPRASLLADLAVAPRDPGFLALAALAIVFPLGIGLVVTTMPVYAADAGLGEAQIGLALAINGPLLAALALPVNAAIESRGPYRFLPLSCVFLVACYLLAASSGGFWTLTLAIIVFTGGELIFSAAVPAAVARLAPPGLRGAYQGAWGFVFAIALGSALAASGLLRGAIGWGGTWLVWAALTAVAGLALLFARPAFRRLAAARAEADAAP